MHHDVATRTLIHNLVKDFEIPQVLTVRQKFDARHVTDLEAELEKEFQRAAIERRWARIKPGDRVAITAGSRQITDNDRILRMLVGEVKRRGGLPFIVPAMGSHGGASAQGQKEVLASLGITEARMDCPIVSDMAVSHVGRTSDGHEVYIDRNAAQADHIIVAHRIKIHPCFHGPYESGLMKMMTIGLGKQYGAQLCHEEGFGRMSHNVEHFARCILQHAPILLGVAIVENAYDQTYALKALTPEEIPEEEPKLLDLARAKMGRLLFDDAEVLVVDWMGKNLSGSGMDSNIIGRSASPFASGGIKAQHLAVLDLTEESHGNSIGLGLADATTRKLMDKVCPELSYVNALTSLVCAGCKLPMVLDTDEDAIKACLRMTVGPFRNHPRLIHIKDTLHIGTIEVSASMRDEVEGNPDLEIIAPVHPLKFDEGGNLLSTL